MMEIALSTRANPRPSATDPTKSTNPQGTPKRKPARGDTRQRLIDCGVELLSERGFNFTGIDEVLKKASVPKGSFYHYFESKQAFADAVIGSYAAFSQKRLDKSFGMKNLSPFERFRLYIEISKRGIEKYDFKRGCLIGNLGQELGGIDDYFRTRIRDVVSSWEEVTTQCLNEAVERGDAREDLDVPSMSTFFWTGWEGAILWAKVSRSNAPIDQFAYGFFLAISKHGSGAAAEFSHPAGQ